MNVQEVIDDHEERIAATPQKPHIKSAAFDWDSKCTCANMYPKLKYNYMSTHVSHHIISHTQALLRGAARQILPVTMMSTCQSILLTIRQYTSHMHFICTQDAGEDAVEIWQ